LLGDLRGADGTVPHEGRDVVQWKWGGRELLQRGAELPLPRQVLLAPQATQQVVILHGKRDRLADVLTEPRIDGAGVAAAEHEVHATLREVLGIGVILRDPHRVGGGDQRGRSGELEGSVCAARFASRMGGFAGAMNGGLWCWPVAKTSSPSASAFFAISTVFLMRSCSLGTSPVTGLGVTSPMVKIPNCIH